MEAISFGFLGAGRMASALAGGLVRAGLTVAERIVAYDPVAAAGESFAQTCGGRLLASNRQVAAEADCVVLATKPQQVASVLSEMGTEACRGKLVVSIASGIRLAMLAQGLGEGARLVRVMPNTPCLVSRGASAFCMGPGATADDAALVTRLLEAVGRAWQVDESLLDAVTGLSGSGPAYVYLVIEALSDAGTRMGLPRDVASGLAAQTVLGAAEMVLATGLHPGVLKEQVTSPGGTTLAGLHVLEELAVRGALMSAVEAATERSRQLGRPGGGDG